MPDFNSLDPTLTILAGALLFLVVLVLYIIHTKKVAALTDKLAALTGQIDQRAREQYEQWQQRDYKALVAQQSAVAHRESQAALNHWKIDSEAGIRQDAIARSRAVIVGKVTEHLVPQWPRFPTTPKTPDSSEAPSI